MKIFSTKGIGCLALSVLLIGGALACPLLLSDSSAQLRVENKEIRVAPGAEFTVHTEFPDLEKRMPQALEFSPQGPKDGPVWSFDDAKSDGLVLGGNALAMSFLAPTQPGTYTLTAKFRRFLSQKIRCRVIVKNEGGVTGPALGLLNPVINQKGKLEWVWATEPVKAGCSATLLQDGSVLVAGGWVKTNEGLTSDRAFRYWPQEKRVLVLEPLSRSRAEHEAALLTDGRVLLFGGQVQGGGQRNDGDLFDPVTNRFDRIPEVRTDQLDSRIAALPDGKVLIYPYQNRGYTHPDTLPPPTAYLLDPKTKAVTSLGPALALRDRPTLTPLPDGRVLVVGPPVLFSTAELEQLPDTRAMTELYLPDQKTFVPGPETRFGRREHKAVLLHSGKVLILGGWSKSIVYGGMGGSKLVLPDRCELFDPATGQCSESERLDEAHPKPFALLADDSLLVIGNSELLRVYLGQSGSSASTSVAPLVGIHAMTPLSDGRALILGASEYGTGIFYP